MESAAVPRQEVEAHLDRVLASPTFKGAERSAQVLRYIVSETLQGRGANLKDYTLGAEGLGRGEAFDPRTDPIARVEASRLRTRLELYYATDGAMDEVRILVPRGGYVPVFERRLSPSTAPLPVPSEPSPDTDRPSTEAEGLPGGRSTPWRVLSAGVLASLATWWIVAPRSAPQAPPTTRLELTTPATADPASLAVSPDGRNVVFSARDGERSRLWIRDLGQPAATPLVGTENGTLPFWAADGRAIGFFADGRINAIDVSTRVVRTLSTAPVSAGATWNEGGVVLHPLVPDSPLFRTAVGQGTLEPATVLAPGQTGHRGPLFLPDGRHFLFYAAGSADARGVHVGELGATHATRLLEADAPAVFVPPASLVYVLQGTLFARRFDPATATVSGDPIALADHVSVESNAGIAPIAAASGTVAYRTGPVAPQRQFVWVDRRGQEMQRINTPEERGPAYASLAPDGHRLAVQRAIDGNTDIWVMDLARGPAVRLTTVPQADTAPVWAPAGDRVAYASQVDGTFELFESPVNRVAPRLLLRTGEAKQITDWSRDGRFLLYRAISTTPTADVDIYAVALDGHPTPVPIVKTAFDERNARFSPDGRWVAYQSNESGQQEVYVQPFDGAGERQRLSTDGGVQPQWRADGSELFYLALDGSMMAVPMSQASGASLQAGAPVRLFQTHLGAVQGMPLNSYIAAADGQRFLLDLLVDQHPGPIAVIVNWQAPWK